MTGIDSALGTVNVALASGVAMKAMTMFGQQKRRKKKRKRK